MQTRAAQRRKSLARGLAILAVLLLAGPLLIGLVAPDTPWLSWLAGVSPAVMLGLSFQLWYRADKVFDRDFDPEDEDRVAESSR